MNIIFDLGGVVLNWNPRVLIQKVFREEEKRKHIWEKVFGHPDWVAFDRGEFDGSEALERFTVSSGEKRERIRELLDSVPPSLTVNRDTVSLMEKLHKKHALYCLSNMNIPAAAYIRKHVGFWPLFRGVVISCDIKMAKPEEGIYRYLLQQFNLESGDCVFIDDTEINLVTAASLGIHPVLFSDPVSCEKELERIDTGISG